MKRGKNGVDPNGRGGKTKGATIRGGVHNKNVWVCGQWSLQLLISQCVNNYIQCI